MTMAVTFQYRPACPLELESDHRGRYDEVRQLRIEVCGRPEQPVVWLKDGTVQPGSPPKNNPLSFEAGKLDDSDERKRISKRKLYLKQKLTGPSY